MEIVKLVTAKFNPEPKNLKSWKLKYDEIDIEFRPQSGKNDMDFLILSKRKLEALPKLNSDNEIIITKKETEPLERAIENSVNLFSIAEKLSKTLSSTIPSIIFMPEDQNEENWLKSTTGIKSNFKKWARLNSTVKIDFKFCVENLQDRLDGVSLMSEAFSHSTDAGKFRDYFRVFERAFTVSSKKLITPLFEFLSNTIYEYKKHEIEEWVKIRHGLTHADKKKDFYLESDVSLILKRVEQAAFDVLFNKTIWRSPETERRNLYYSEIGLYGRNKIYIPQGGEGSLSTRFFDETGSYPLNLNARFSGIPDNWKDKYRELNIIVPLGKVISKHF